MIKPKYKKGQNKFERQLWNYDRRQYRSKQALFERRSVFSVSQFGFNDIDDILVSVIDRMTGKVGKSSPHRPNLFDNNYLVGEIRHIDE